MSCNHKMLATRNSLTGEVKFIGAVSQFSPKRIKQLENTSPSFIHYIKLPCGRCIGCRIAKSKEWAVRIMHEAQFSDTCCFLTLTFDEDRLFEWFYNKGIGEKKARLKAMQLLWSLDLKTYQDFMKRLRKKVSPKKIRFFHCGEYGSKKGRPHHHAIIFGYDFPDRVLKSYKKIKGDIINYYISDELSELWPFGFHIISEVTENSAGYCARYVTKKINGDMSDLYYNGRKKEYITMSRNKGIGYQWFEKYGKTDCFPQDFVLDQKQFKMKPPRYYDKLYDLECPDDFDLIKKAREKVNRDIMMNLEHKCTIDDTADRQDVLEQVNNTKLKRLIRSYERGDFNVKNYEFIEFVNKCSAFGIPNKIVNEAISTARSFSNEYIDAVTLANQYLDAIYGELTYKDLEV